MARTEESSKRLGLVWFNCLQCERLQMTSEKLFSIWRNYWGYFQQNARLHFLQLSCSLQFYNGKRWRSFFFFFFLNPGKRQLISDWSEWAINVSGLLNTKPVLYATPTAYPDISFLNRQQGSISSALWAGFNVLQTPLLIDELIRILVCLFYMTLRIMLFTILKIMLEQLSSQLKEEH